MKKPSKLALYTLAASFFVVTTPLDASKENPLEITLRCAASGNPNTVRTHTPKEISQIFQEVYRYTFNKPPYFSEKLVGEVIRQESGHDPMAKSKKGARGLMQLMPDAWNEVENCNYEEYASDPRINMEAGMKYFLALDKFLKENHPRWEELSTGEKRKAILAAYNGGKSRFAEREWDVSGMYRETRKYVEMVMNGLENEF